MKITKAWLIILICLSSTFAYSQVYKWVDSDGRVHYSDKPKSKGKKVQKVKYKSEISAGESERARNKLEALKLRQEQNEQVNKINNKMRKQAQAKERRRQAAVKENCRRAKRNIKTLNSESRAPIRRKDEFGVPGGYVTLKQRPAELKKQQDYYDKNC